MQLTEHEPVQVMWQVELPLHETLPLAPSVVVQTELSVQLRLHESRQAPAQLVWFAQESEQLPASPPQVPAVKAQLIPELHEQVAPVQAGGGVGVELDPPHAPRPRKRTRTGSRVRMSDCKPRFSSGCAQLLPECDGAMRARSSVTDRTAGAVSLRISSARNTVEATP